MFSVVFAMAAEVCGGLLLRRLVVEALFLRVAFPSLRVRLNYMTAMEAVSVGAGRSIAHLLVVVCARVTA
jgi:hypothetical protein